MATQQKGAAAPATNDRTAEPAHERESVRLFVEHYMANGGNAAAAYRATHPNCRSVNAAYAASSRLLRSVKVKQMLEARRSTDGHIMTREERQQFWSDIARGVYPEAGLRERRRASETLGKSQGDFVEQHEIRADVEYHLTWDDQEESTADAPTVQKRARADVAIRPRVRGAR